MKKFLYFVMIMCICICISFILPINANASEIPSQYYAQYSGSAKVEHGFEPYCTFTINKIVDNKFDGSFSAANLGAYSFDDEDIRGDIYFSNSTISYTCKFTTKFYNDQYFLI